MDGHPNSGHIRIPNVTEIRVAIHMKSDPKTSQLRAEIQVLHVACAFHIGWSSAFKIDGGHRAGLV